MQKTTHSQMSGFFYGIFHFIFQHFNSLQTNSHKKMSIKNQPPWQWLIFSNSYNIKIYAFAFDLSASSLSILRNTGCISSFEINLPALILFVVISSSFKDKS